MSRGGVPRRGSATPTESAGSRPSASQRCCWHGHWDEAAGLPTPSWPRPKRGFPTAFEHDARLVRSRIRLAHDQAPGALEDSSRAARAGTAGGLPRHDCPGSRCTHACWGHRGYRRPGPRRGTPLSFWPERFPTSYWVADLAFALRGLEGSQLLLAAAKHARTSSRWLEAARAVALGEYARASEVYAAIGSLPDELLSRIGAAREALAARRPHQAEVELSLALPAMGRIGAGRYVREGEALLAPSGERAT